QRRPEPGNDRPLAGISGNHQKEKITRMATLAPTIRFRNGTIRTGFPSPHTRLPGKPIGFRSL
ncbi:MAG: hypothetical protein ACK47R_19265, partial [Planctomycetia bacterium]